MKNIFLLIFITLFSFSTTDAQEVYWPVDVEEINTGSNSTYLIQSANIDGYSVIYGYVLGAFFTNDDGDLQCGGFLNCSSGQVQLALMGDDTTTGEKDGFYDGEEITWLAYGSFLEQTYTASVLFSTSPPFGSNSYSTNGINIVTQFNISSVVIGCMNVTACNFNENATEDLNTCTFAEANENCDGTCIDTDGDLVCDIYEVLGCTNITACNYNEFATEEDSSCTYPVPNLECGETAIIGCINTTACNYNELATVEGQCFFTDTECQVCSGEIDGSGVILFNDDDLDGVCNQDEVYGCTDLLYTEYSTEATEDDNSCEILIVLGCTDINAFNYDLNANTNDGNCVFEVQVDFETTETLITTNFAVTIDTIDLQLGDSELSIGDLIGGFYLVGEQLYCAGFTAWTGSDLSLNLWMDNPSTEEIDGVTEDTNIYWVVQQDETLFNYLVELTINQQGEYIFVTQMTLNTTTIIGCSDSDYLEYNLNANTDDGSCVSVSFSGCTNPLADNYNPFANFNDGSCIETACPYDIFTEYSSTADIYDVALCETIVIEGCTDETAFNTTEGANTDDGSCEAVVIGCTDETAFNTTEGANTDDGSCEAVVIGCTDETAFNTTEEANTDDGSCIDVVLGCTDETAFNTTEGANSDDGSCIDVVLGCTDETAYNPTAGSNTNDGSCVYVGCTDLLADNYNSQATIDDSSCFIYGCTLDVFPNYNSQATLDDFSCDMNSIDVFGCTSDLADNFDLLVTEDNGSCIYSGCTDLLADNYNSLATIEDGSCHELGCTSDWADNYNVLATEDDGSCYKLGCIDSWADNFDPNATISSAQLPNQFVGNTGANMTLMLSPAFINSLDITYENAYIVALTSDGMVVGSANIYGVYQLSIALWGDDYSTLYVDGVLPNQSISFQLVDGMYLYDIIMPSPVSYTTNGMSFQVSAGVLSLDSGDDCVRLGCTSDWADNYDALASVDDGSCEVLGCTDNGLAIVDDYNNNTGDLGSDGYDDDGIYDLDGNGNAAANFNHEATVNNYSCLATILEGCIDPFAFNFCDACNVDNDSCIQVILGCSDETACNYSLEAGVNTDDGSCLYVDGVCDTCVDGVIVNNDIDSDGVCNADEVYGCTDTSAYNYNASATEDDGLCIYTVIGCTNVSDCNYDVLATIDDESCIGQPGCLDHFYLEYNPLAGCSLESACQTSWIQLYDSLQVAYINLNEIYLDSISQITLSYNSLDEECTQEMILSSFAIDSLNYVNVSYIDSITQITINYNSLEEESAEDMFQSGLTIDSLNYLNGSLSEEVEYWSSPILIDLILGWNIIGYTFKDPQDIVATLQVIEDVILIVKNNAAEVYWPEYGFNGIGNLIPGQGYQIKVSDEYIGFTYPNVNGERIELTPTVPQWAIDMEVEMHPNDIRTLVRIVNMLGQEVNPATQFNGEVLLYLYNDGTVEKTVK